MWKKLLTAVAWSVLAAIPAVGFAQPAGTNPPVQSDPNSESGASYSATDLLDSQVKGAEGQVIAEVEDFVLDSQSNQVQYVVVAYGNVPDVAGRVFVVPINQFQVRRDVDVVILETRVPIDRLKAAPNYAAGEWRTVVRQPRWRADADKFWGGVNVNVNVDPNGANPNPNRPKNPDRPNPDRPAADPNKPNPDRPAPTPDRPNAGPDRPQVDPNRPNPTPDRPTPPAPKADAPKADAPKPDAPKPDAPNPKPPGENPGQDAPRGNGPSAPNPPGQR